MAEYVDRNRLKEAIREDALNCLSCYNGEVLDLVLMDIDEVPAPCVALRATLTKILEPQSRALTAGPI